MQTEERMTQENAPTPNKPKESNFRYLYENSRGGLASLAFYLFYFITIPLDGWLSIFVPLELIMGILFAVIGLFSDKKKVLAIVGAILSLIIVGYLIFGLYALETCNCSWVW
jgi:urea transporter